MKNPITAISERRAEKKKIEQIREERKGEREQKRLERIKKKTTEEALKTLTTAQKNAEAKFDEAMDNDDHGSAKVYANQVKLYENSINQANAVDREAEQIMSIAIANAHIAKILDTTTQFTEELKKTLANILPPEKLDALVAKFEMNREDIREAAKVSEEIITDAVSISPKDEITDEELKAMKERYKARKAAKEGGVKAVEGADKEIADMLGSLGNPVGSS
jgi:hypothetical protein